MLSFYKFALVISDRVFGSLVPGLVCLSSYLIPDSRGIGWSKTSRREGERGRGRGTGREREGGEREGEGGWEGGREREGEGGRERGREREG